MAVPEVETILRWVIPALVVFAVVYLSMSQSSPTHFSEPLDQLVSPYHQELPCGLWRQERKKREPGRKLWKLVARCR